MADLRWLAAAALAAVALTLSAPPAAARDATLEEVRALAGRAADGDDEAAESLRDVDRVDGRPVDLRTALDTDDPVDRAARLRTMAEGAPTSAAPPAAEARRDARDILDGRDYRESRLPRPFRGVLRRIGEWLEPLGGPLDPVGRFLVSRPGAITAAVLVAAAAGLVASRVARRRARAAAAAGGVAGRADAREDPDRLEREAARAEAAGDLERALRLRFKAGLLRLDRQGVVRYRPSLRSGDLDRTLHSPTFADLARAFDEVVYGGRPADPTDLETARREWPRVLTEAGRR